MEVVERDPWAPTCNIAYPRSMLERLGGFDERFGAAWGEDTDLALRAAESGAEQDFVSGALTWHAVHPRTLPRALGEAVARRNIHAVLRRHPGQRRALYLGLFTKRTHALVVLAAAGLALARRRPALALLAIPYLNAYFDRGAAWTPLRVARWLLAFMPRRALLEVAEVAAMAESSLRHRTPVL
jgi:GT2 family glycosyltransferase